MRKVKAFVNVRNGLYLFSHPQIFLYLFFPRISLFYIFLKGRKNLKERRCLCFLLLRISSHKICTKCTVLLNHRNFLRLRMLQLPTSIDFFFCLQEISGMKDFFFYLTSFWMNERFSIQRIRN